MDLANLFAVRWVTVHSLSAPVQLGIVPVSPAMLSAQAGVLRSLVDQAMAEAEGTERPPPSEEARVTPHQMQALQAVAVAAVRSIRPLDADGNGVGDGGPARFSLREADHDPSAGVFWVGWLGYPDLAAVYFLALYHHGSALERARGFRRGPGNGGDAGRDGEEVRDDA